MTIRVWLGGFSVAIFFLSLFDLVMYPGAGLARIAAALGCLGIALTAFGLKDARPTEAEMLAMVSDAYKRGFADANKQVLDLIDDRINTGR